MAVVSCLALVGCADLAPRSEPSSTGASKVAQAQRTHEYPAAKPPPQHPAQTASSPEAAIRAFATAYVNWSAGTVTADMHALASASIGQARAALQIAAANTAGDYELRQGGIANEGKVEAIGPLRGSHDRYAVVTLERTTASNTTAYQGLRAAWHVTLATVVQVGVERWAISGWQPEN